MFVKLLLHPFAYFFGVNTTGKLLSMKHRFMSLYFYKVQQTKKTKLTSEIETKNVEKWDESFRRKTWIPYLRNLLITITIDCFEALTIVYKMA